MVYILDKDAVNELITNKYLLFSQFLYRIFKLVNTMTIK